MRRLIEFIESYRKIDDGDYQWNDNHGELIRCKECKYWDGKYHDCSFHDDGRDWDSNDYCSRAERKEE